MSRPRPALWPIALLALALVAIGIAGVVPDLFDATPDPIGVGEVPVAYRIVYRVEDGSGDDTVVTTERISVRRPFDARIEIYRGPPPGDELLSTTVSALGLLQTTTAGQEPLVLANDPGTTEGDRRSEAILAEDSATFEDERREVLGRRCDVYALPTPGITGAFERGEQELCVDRAGIVLEERLVGDGRVRQRKVAVSLDLDPGLEDSLFEIEGEPQLNAGTGGFGRVTDESRSPGVTSYELSEPPSGFGHEGRFVYSPPPLAGGGLDPGDQVASVIDAFVRGADFVIVENGGTSSTRRAFEERPDSRKVTVPLGGAEVLWTDDYAEVRVALDEGRFVRVRGTLASAQLLDLVRRLRPVEGTGIEPVQ